MVRLRRRVILARLLLALVLLPHLLLPLVSASPSPQSSKAQEAAEQITAAARALAIAAFMASVLISSVSAFLTARMQHRPIGISFYSLVGATAFLVMLFVLDSFYKTVSGLVGLQGQYQIAIQHVEERINNTKSLISNFALTASVMKTVGGILKGAGEAGLQSLSADVKDKMAGAVKRFKIVGPLSIILMAIGATLYTVGNTLYQMLGTMMFYYGFFFLSLYGLLFLLKFFGELPLWLAFASLGLAIAAFKPLRGLGASLFATMIVFGIGLPLVVNGMELALEAMDIPSYKAVLCGVEVTNVNAISILDLFGKMLTLVLFNPGEYIWCIYEGIAKMAVVPSAFYALGLGILWGGSVELSRWMSESAGFANLAYSLTTVVKPL